jgi:two-component system nitrogen regulation sensor histidine kinase GlnL
VSRPVAQHSRFQSLDLLATSVAVVDGSATVVFANSALEDALGASRRVIESAHFPDFFSDPQSMLEALRGAEGNQYAAKRYETRLLRHGREALAVHAIVAQTGNPGELLVELLPMDQQVRQDREERLAQQSQENKELVRNLAHEIKNPLGGIRGAAQLLELEMDSPALSEYTQVIIREADRLQSLVDRLLAPHRSPHVVGDVNIHEVCEHVLALLKAEYPRGLHLRRDYDVSLPEFRGDREQLIQALLNVAQNACQALAPRIAEGSAELCLHTRAARQLTLGKNRYRLALELHVIDNGPGVPPDIRDRIFLPLVSGREGGSGLGLTLAQNFVQQHQGLIEFESEAGRTDFNLLIPLH